MRSARPFCRRQTSGLTGGGTGAARPADRAVAGCSKPSFIHAYAGHGVVESPLSPPWQRRIVARFHFPKELI
ncbi:conserved hypothetical protein [Rhodobacterales bacterium Y4I]|nr:conserved hypothetical protein [Rhodobacterales bacterium Y4I]